MKKIICLKKKSIRRVKSFDLSFNHQNYINQLYLNEDFLEKNTILKELKKSSKAIWRRIRKKIAHMIQKNI